MCHILVFSLNYDHNKTLLTAKGRRQPGGTEKRERKAETKWKNSTCFQLVRPKRDRAGPLHNVLLLKAYLELRERFPYLTHSCKSQLNSSNSKNELKTRLFSISVRTSCQDWDWFRDHPLVERDFTGQITSEYFRIGLPWSRYPLAARLWLQMLAPRLHKLGLSVCFLDFIHSHYITVLPVINILQVTLISGGNGVLLFKTWLIWRINCYH